MKPTGENSYNEGVPQSDLASYFDKSVAAVREYSDRFEKSYGTPAVSYCLSSFDGYPISSTFVATFAVLSFFPVVSFIGFSLFIITFFMAVALSCALGAIIVVELGLFSVFATVLTATFLFAIPLTGVTVFIYLFTRFLLHVRTGGRQGVTYWADETKRHFLQRKAAAHNEESDESRYAEKPLPPKVNSHHTVYQSKSD